MYLSVIKNKEAKFPPDSPIINPTKDVAEDEIPKIQNFIEAMVEKIDHSNDFGLAANQVGRGQSILVYKNYKTGKTFVMINPKLISKSGKYLSQHEGCLSLPGLRCHVRRAKRITVGFLDRDGQKQVLKIKHDKLQATIIQHELDHLQGILMTDKASETFIQKG